MSKQAMLLHAGEDTIHQPGEDKKPETPKSKWENFWYYHKWHAVVILVIGIIAGFLIHDLLNRVTPDYSIGVIGEKMLLTDGLEEVQGQMAQFGVDRNGDGKVIVQLENYTVVPPGSDMQENAQIQMASMTKLMANLPAGEQLIWITTDGCYEYLKGNEIVFKTLENGSDRIAVEDCKGLSGLTDSMKVLDGMSISIIDISSLSSKDKEETKKNAEESQKLFDQLVYGKQP